MEAQVLPSVTHRIRADSDSPKLKWMNESVLLLIFFGVLKLHTPVSHTGECFWGGGAPWLFRLRHIAVLVCRGLAPLNVLLVDEHLDALLDHADTWVEPGFGLIDDLHTDK